MTCDATLHAGLPNRPLATHTCDASGDHGWHQCHCGFRWRNPDHPDLDSLDPDT